MATEIRPHCFKLVNGTIEQAICISLNVSLRNAITEDILINIFKTGILPKEWSPHISVFYNEVSATRIAYFIKERDISKQNFIAVHSQLTPFYKSYNFDVLLGEIYNYGLEQIA